MWHRLLWVIVLALVAGFALIGVIHGQAGPVIIAVCLGGGSLIPAIKEGLGQ